MSPDDASATDSGAGAGTTGADAGAGVGAGEGGVEVAADVSVRGFTTSGTGAADVEEAETVSLLISRSGKAMGGRMKPGNTESVVDEVPVVSRTGGGETVTPPEKTASSMPVSSASTIPR